MFFSRTSSLPSSVSRTYHLVAHPIDQQQQQQQQDHPYTNGRGAKHHTVSGGKIRAVSQSKKTPAQYSPFTRDHNQHHNDMAFHTSGQDIPTSANRKSPAFADGHGSNSYSSNNSHRNSNSSNNSNSTDNSYGVDRPYSVEEGWDSPLQHPSWGRLRDALFTADDVIELATELAYNPNGASWKFVSTVPASDKSLIYSSDRERDDSAVHDRSDNDALMPCIGIDIIGDTDADGGAASPTGDTGNFTISQDTTSAGYVRGSVPSSLMGMLFGSNSSDQSSNKVGPGPGTLPAAGNVRLGKFSPEKKDEVRDNGTSNSWGRKGGRVNTESSAENAGGDSIVGTGSSSWATQMVKQLSPVSRGNSAKILDERFALSAAAVIPPEQIELVSDSNPSRRNSVSRITKVVSSATVTPVTVVADDAISSTKSQEIKRSPSSAMHPRHPPTSDILSSSKAAMLSATSCGASVCSDTANGSTYNDTNGMYNDINDDCCDGDIIDAVASIDISVTGDDLMEEDSHLHSLTNGNIHINGNGEGFERFSPSPELSVHISRLDYVGNGEASHGVLNHNDDDHHGENNGFGPYYSERLTRVDSRTLKPRRPRLPLPLGDDGENYGFEPYHSDRLTRVDSRTLIPRRSRLPPPNRLGSNGDSNEDSDDFCLSDRLTRVDSRSLIPRRGGNGGGRDDCGGRGGRNVNGNWAWSHNTNHSLPDQSSSLPKHQWRPASFRASSGTTPGATPRSGKSVRFEPAHSNQRNDGNEKNNDGDDDHDDVGSGEDSFGFGNETMDATFASPSTRKLTRVDSRTLIMPSSKTNQYNGSRPSIPSFPFQPRVSGRRSSPDGTLRSCGDGSGNGNGSFIGHGNSSNISGGGGGGVERTKESGPSKVRAILSSMLPIGQGEESNSNHRAARQQQQRGSSTSFGLWKIGQRKQQSASVGIAIIHPAALNAGSGNGEYSSNTTTTDGASAGIGNSYFQHNPDSRFTNPRDGNLTNGIHEADPGGSEYSVREGEEGSSNDADKEELPVPMTRKLLRVDSRTLVATRASASTSTSTSQHDQQQQESRRQPHCHWKVQQQPHQKPLHTPQKQQQGQPQFAPRKFV